MSVEVLVVGSVNIDTFLRGDRIPRPGETVTVASIEESTGGKGANQAAAAALCGARAAFAGCVGDDYGAVLDELTACGVDTSLVDVVADADTGRAFVLVDADGENSIAVHPGANHLIGEDVVAAALATAVDAVVLAQAEVGAQVLGLVATGVGEGRRFVLNLAPAIDVDDTVLARADPLVVNLTEAELLTRERPDTDDPVEWGTVLADRLAATSRTVVVTLGAAGAVVADGSQVTHVSATSATAVVDTTRRGGRLRRRSRCRSRLGAHCRRGSQFRRPRRSRSRQQPRHDRRLPAGRHDRRVAVSMIHASSHARSRQAA